MLRACISEAFQKHFIAIFRKPVQRYDEQIAFCKFFFKKNQKMHFLDFYIFSILSHNVLS